MDRCPNYIALIAAKLEAEILSQNNNQGYYTEHFDLAKNSSANIVTETELLSPHIRNIHLLSKRVSQTTNFLTQHEESQIQKFLKYFHRCENFASQCQTYGRQFGCALSATCLTHLNSPNGYITCTEKIATPAQVANGETICLSLKVNAIHPNLLLDTKCLARFTAATIRKTEIGTIKTVEIHLNELQRLGEVHVKSRTSIIPSKWSTVPLSSTTSVLEQLRERIPLKRKRVDNGATKVSKVKEDSTSKVSEKRFENVIAIPSPKSQICDLSELEDDLRMKQFNLKNDENGGERK